MRSVVLILMGLGVAGTGGAVYAAFEPSALGELAQPLEHLTILLTCFLVGSCFVGALLILWLRSARGSMFRSPTLASRQEKVQLTTSGRMHGGRQPIERRKWPRLPATLEVAFQAIGAQGSAQGTGTTQDVSAGGVFFATPNWEGLAPGQKVELQLSDSKDGDTAFREKATIVRLHRPETSQKKSAPTGGVALCFERRPRLNVYPMCA